MKVRVLEVFIVTIVALFSWLFMFALECYFGYREIRHSNTRAGPPFPDANSDNIFWFLQISDIHFSFVNNFSISDSLEAFCHDVIATVHPSLIIVSGDLTHAKLADERRSQQFSSEWRAYHTVLEKCNLKIPWLDIRGNHDDFNVPSFVDSSNYFLIGSFQGVRKSMHLMCALILVLNDLWSFTQELSSIWALSRRRGNHTIWFTHYPSAIISTDHHQLRQLMGSSIAHVCGHLHTLGGFVPHMYGKHPSGHLELELADFTDSRRFRLMAFDHDLFSFIDVALKKWPLILVTNPKNAEFLAPTREPTKRMLNSSHIRILVFSTTSIELISLEIDGFTLPSPVAVDNGPLYVTPWQPSKYYSGLHHMKVTAKDAFGRTTVYEQPFSLDDTPSPISRLPQLLLLTDLHSLLRLAFLFIWLAVLSIIVLSWMNQSERTFFYHFVRAKSIFYPYLLLFVYFGIGPWYIGEVVTGVYGFVSVHGVYLMGRFIPGSMTYLHGTLQVMLFYVPFLYYLNYTLSRSTKTCHRWICTCIMLLCIMAQTLWVLQAYPYGYIALILSPGVTWPVVLIMWMIYKSNKTIII